MAKQLQKARGISTGLSSLPDYERGAYVFNRKRPCPPEELPRCHTLIIGRGNSRVLRGGGSGKSTRAPKLPQFIGGFKRNHVDGRAPERRRLGEVKLFQNEKKRTESVRCRGGRN